MKKLLVFLFSMLISVNSYGDSSVSGKMQCTITGQKILGSRLGETQEFEGFQGGWNVNDSVFQSGWNVNDSLELIYSVPSSGDFCLSLEKPGGSCHTFDPDAVSLFTAFLPFDLLKGSLLYENMLSVRWVNVFSLILQPDDILANFYGQKYLRLSQYGDNWDGVFTDFSYPENYVRVLTFNCGNSSGDNVQKLTNSMYAKFK